MKNLILSVQSDFEFPLAEAARKQIFEEAKHLRRKGLFVEVLILTNYEREEQIIDGIKIKLIKKKNIFKSLFYLNSFDKIHFLGNIGIYAMLTSICTPLKDKVITIADGGVLSLGTKQWKINQLIKIFHLFYDKFYVYTNYQKTVFLNVSKKYEKKLEVVSPILDKNIEKTYSKYEKITILYMGHLSKFKGLDVVFYIFKELKKEISDLQLIVANNGVMKDEEVFNEFVDLKAKYGSDIIDKGKIDPYEELSKSHLYIYPFKQPNGTFAFPLSLYESLLSNTPFLGPNINGVKEFFNECFLANPNDKIQCLEKAKKLIQTNNHQEIDNNLQVISKKVRINE